MMLYALISMTFLMIILGKVMIELSSSTRTIHLSGPLHVYAVEMYACRLVLEVVRDVNDESVAFVDCYSRRWPLVVDHDDRPRCPMWTQPFPAYGPV
jgi:hypothetical protein